MVWPSGLGAGLQSQSRGFDSRHHFRLDSTTAVRPRGMGKIRVRFPVEARRIGCPMLCPSGEIGRRAGFKIRCPGMGRPSSNLGAGTHALIAQRIEQATSNRQVRGSIPRGGTEGGTRRPGGFDSRRPVHLRCAERSASAAGSLAVCRFFGRLGGVRPKRTGSGLQNHRLRVRGPPPLRPCSSDGRAFD